MENKTIEIVKMCILTVGLCISSVGCKNNADKVSKEGMRMSPLYTTSLGTGSGRNCAESENGFYWLKREKTTGITTIMFYDNEKKESNILCNRPSCTHDTGQCAAVLQGDWNSIAYWNDHLYFIADKMKYENDKWILEKERVLWRADATGEKREELYTVDLPDTQAEEGAVQSTGYSINSYGFGDGYLIARIMKEIENKDRNELQSTDCLMAFPVEGSLKEAITLETYDDSDSSGAVFLCATENTIYLYDSEKKEVIQVVVPVTKEETTEKKTTVEKWNVEGLMGAAVIDKALYFYAEGRGVFKWNDNENEPVCLIEDEGWDTPCVLWNENGIVVQDLSASDNFEGNAFRCYDLNGTAQSEWISVPGMVAVWEYQKDGVFLEDRTKGIYYFAELEKMKNGENELQILE